MQSTNDHAVTVLNGLIETTMDSSLGYRDAAEAATSTGLKTLFLDRSHERKEISVEFQNEVRKLGGEPEDEGTMLASAQRMFVGLKHAVVGNDLSVVSAVEAGEDYVKAQLQAALDGDDLPISTRTVVTDVFGRIKADHDKMRDLKHAEEALSKA